MKLGLYIFGFILFCLMGFLSVGLFTNSISYENSITVNRPKVKCWRLFQKKEYTANWMLGFKRMDLLEGIPETEGAKFKLVFDDNGSEKSMLETTRTWIKEKEFSFVLEHTMMTMQTTIEFSDPFVNATLIHSKSTVVGTNVFYKSLFFFLKSTFKEKDMENYIRLKSFIESKEAEQY